jgi:hypothetical protein
MQLNRPIVISIMRFAGGAACAAGAALLVLALWSGELNALFLLSAAMAGAVGFTFLGFATNLVILHDILAHLEGSRQK